MHCVASVLNPNLQDTPETIPNLLETHLRGGFDVVYAIREKRKKPCGYELVTLDFIAWFENYPSWISQKEPEILLWCGKASGRPDEAAARTSVDYVLANDRLWLWPSPIWCILWLSWIWFLGEGMSAHNSNSIIRFFHACYWESERSTQHKSRLFIGNGWNRLANKFVYLLEEPIDKSKKEACRIRAGFFGWFIWLELFTEKVQPVLFVFLFRLYFFSLFAREFFSQLTDRVSNGGFWSLL